MIKRQTEKDRIKSLADSCEDLTKYKAESYEPQIKAIFGMTISEILTSPVLESLAADEAAFTAELAALSGKINQGRDALTAKIETLKEQIEKAKKRKSEIVLTIAADYSNGAESTPDRLKALGDTNAEIEALEDMLKAMEADASLKKIGQDPEGLKKWREIFDRGVDLARSNHDATSGVRAMRERLELLKLLIKIVEGRISVTGSAYSRHERDVVGAFGKFTPHLAGKPDALEAAANRIISDRLK